MEKQKITISYLNRADDIIFSECVGFVDFCALGVRKVANAKKVKFKIIDEEQSAIIKEVQDFEYFTNRGFDILKKKLL